MACKPHAIAIRAPSNGAAAAAHVSRTGRPNQTVPGGEAARGLQLHRCCCWPSALASACMCMCRCRAKAFRCSTRVPHHHLLPPNRHQTPAVHGSRLGPDPDPGQIIVGQNKIDFTQGGKNPMDAVSQSHSPMPDRGVASRDGAGVLPWSVRGMCAAGVCAGGPPACNRRRRAFAGGGGHTRVCFCAWPHAVQGGDQLPESSHVIASCKWALTGSNVMMLQVKPAPSHCGPTARLARSAQQHAARQSYSVSCAVCGVWGADALLPALGQRDEDHHQPPADHGLPGQLLPGRQAAIGGWQLVMGGWSQWGVKGFGGENVRGHG